MASTQQPLPATHRALVLESTSSPPTVQTLPTPQPVPGSAVVRILSAGILTYAHQIYNGTLNYPFPTPLVPGHSAIGRIAACGPDATTLKPGQLVYVDSFVRARDDASVTALLGVSEGHSYASKKLMGEWRDWTYAEFAKVPLENCFVLAEEVLCGKMGYGVEVLQDIARLLVPYGGLVDIGLKPGETVIITQATSTFGSAAVRVALALGARVIAMARSPHKLATLTSHSISLRQSHRIRTVPITGDVAANTASLKSFGRIDAWFDISPPEAKDSTHYESCFMALGKGGRISAMGGINATLNVPFRQIVLNDLTIKGKWMYERKDVGDFIKMVEYGVVQLGQGKVHVEKYGLEEWKRGFDAAKEGKVAVICP